MVLSEFRDEIRETVEREGAWRWWAEMKCGDTYLFDVSVSVHRDEGQYFVQSELNSNIMDFELLEDCEFPTLDEALDFVTTIELKEK